jgi:hypothetical protein
MSRPFPRRGGITRDRGDAAAVDISDNVIMVYFKTAWNAAVKELK